MSTDKCVNVRRWAAVGVGLALAVTACSSQGGSAPPTTSPPVSTPAPALPPTAVILYRSDNGSVAPQYQESVKLRATQRKTQSAARTGADVVRDETPTTTAQWAALTEGYPQVAALQSSTTECAGASEYALKIVNEGEVIDRLLLNTCSDESEAAIPVLRSWIATVYPDAE